MEGPCNHLEWTFLASAKSVCCDCGITWDRAEELGWQAVPMKLRTKSMVWVIATDKREER